MASRKQQKQNFLKKFANQYNITRDKFVNADFLPIRIYTKDEDSGYKVYKRALDNMDETKFNSYEYCSGTGDSRQERKQRFLNKFAKEYSLTYKQLLDAAFLPIRIYTKGDDSGYGAYKGALNSMSEDDFPKPLATDNRNNILEYFIQYSKERGVPKSALLKLQEYQKDENYPSGFSIEAIHKVIEDADENEFFNAESAELARRKLNKPLENAQKRNQPYVDLTDNILKTEDLLSEELLKKYKVRKLKSLFFRTEKLELTKLLGKQIQKATDIGIKEIFIFCDRDKSNLNATQFNKFLEQHKIRINFRIAPISEQDIKNIREDDKYLEKSKILKEPLDELTVKKDETTKKFNSSYRELLDVVLDEYFGDYEDSKSQWKITDKEKDEVYIKKIHEKIQGSIRNPALIYWALKRLQSDKNWDYGKGLGLLSDLNQFHGKNINIEKVKVLATKTGGVRQLAKELEEIKKKISEQEKKILLHNVHLNIKNKKNLLSIAQLSEHKISYKNHFSYKDNGYKIDLLTNDKSDEIITFNYNGYKGLSAAENPTVLKEPSYITSATNPNAEKRIKDPNKVKASLEIQHQVNRNTELSNELSKTLDKSIDKEEEININEAQAALKYGRDLALVEAQKLIKSLFFDFYISLDYTTSRGIMDDFIKFTERAVNRLFDSSNKIEFVTKDALLLITQNYYAFQQGINMNNLPVGLAFKNGIIFKSDQRPSSMPINDFTIKFDEIRPTMDHPLLYSWLDFASKATLSLEDIFRSEEAPADGRDNHPLLEGEGLYGCTSRLLIDRERKCDPYDTKLDLAVNLLWSQYEQKDQSIYLYQQLRDIDRVVMNNLKKDNIEDFEDINFYGISDADRVRLTEIKRQLKKRGILEVFLNVIKNNYVVDGTFLLEKRAAQFLNKLFNEILPYNGNKDNKKLDFFKKSLIGHKFGVKPEESNGYNSDYYPIHDRALAMGEDDDAIEACKSSITCKLEPYAHNSRLLKKFDLVKSLNSFEDVFEGLNGCWNRLQDFKARNEIRKEEWQDLESKFAVVIKNQMENAENLRVVQERTWNVLDYIISKGGNLEEQLESLMHKDSISLLHDPVQYEKALQFGINTIHAVLELPKDAHDPYQADTMSLDVLKEQLYEKNYSEDLLDRSQLLLDSIRYLATIPAYKRPSINTYLNFFENYSNVGLEPFDSGYRRRCISGEGKDHLQTVEYIQIERLKEDIPENKLNYDTLNNAKKSYEKGSCFTPTAVISGKDTADINLVTGFTSYQASENVRLLALNILSSVGENYDPQYPDQEFSAFVSLFRVLFSEVKFDKNIEIGQGKLHMDSIQGRPQTRTVYTKNDINDSYTLKNIQHKIIVDSFINIYKNHPELNFIQIVSAGLVANQCGDSIDTELAELVEQGYGYHLTRLLRILLTIPISNENKLEDFMSEKESLEELKKRSGAIQNTIKNLCKTVKYAGKDQKIYDLLTKEGVQSENLQFFALVFGNKKDVAGNDIADLITKLDNLSLSLKSKLLKSYENHKLPYYNGKIFKNDYVKREGSSYVRINHQEILIDDFPTISLEMLGKKEEIERVIRQISSKDHQISKNELHNKIKYNDSGSDTIRNTKVDLNVLESKHSIRLSTALKDKNFKELREKILGEESFVRNNIKSSISNTIVQDITIVQAISRDIIKLMFKAIEKRAGEWKTRVDLITDLLFDNKKSLKEQFRDIEENKKNIDKIFCRYNSEEKQRLCIDDNEQTELLNALLRKPNAKGQILKNLLEFLRDLDLEILKINGVTLSQLILDADPKFILEHFDLFKFTANFYLESDIAESFDLFAFNFYLKPDFTTSLKKIYSLVQKISQLDSSTSSAKKILTYCVKNDNYYLIEIFSQINSKIKNITEFIDWFTTLEVSEIKILSKNKNLNFEELFAKNSIEKVQIIIDIALKLNDALNSDQYDKIIKQITKKDIYYAKLLHSYLSAPSRKYDIKEDKISSRPKKNKLYFIKQKKLMLKLLEDLRGKKMTIYQAESIAKTIKETELGELKVDLHDIEIPYSGVCKIAYAIELASAHISLTFPSGHKGHDKLVSALALNRQEDDDWRVSNRSYQASRQDDEQTIKDALEEILNPVDGEDTKIFFTSKLSQLQAKSLANALANTSIEYLEISGLDTRNSRGLRYIADAIRKTNLEYLKIAFFSSLIIDKNVEYIADAIRESSARIDIDYDLEDIRNETTRKKLEEAVSENNLHIGRPECRNEFMQPSKISHKWKIDIVMKNLESLEDAQKIFSNYEAWRFKFNKDELIEKIKKIKRKNTKDGKDDTLLSSEEIELYRSAVSTYHKLDKYRNLNSNKIEEKALELKHKRSLLKDNALQEIRELDLEYLALTLEMMYRTIGLFPRDVQLLSVLTTIIHTGLNLVQEIKTGEGKGIVAALHAVYLNFIGQTVDVITSSPELAARDLKEFSPFYKSLGIIHSNHIIKPNSDLHEYKEFGIHYSTPSGIALFKADMNFYSIKNNPALNADISVVFDEVDFTKKSPINYKLATSLIPMTQEEARMLFQHILKFTKTKTFQNDDPSPKDDVENLKRYLKYQRKKLEKKSSKDAILLHGAYKKCEQRGIDEVLDQLLNSAIIAQGQREGFEYVLPSEDQLKNNEILHQVIPIGQEEQPAKGTSFSDGVQAFVHLIIEENHPELQGKFDISAPASTIFNISPKNLIDNYRLTGGKIIGITGTVGNDEDVQELLENTLLSFGMPRYKKYNGDIKQQLVSNKDEQYQETLDAIDKDTRKPVLIFCDSVKEAEEVFEHLKAQISVGHTLQLFAASPKDTTKSVKEVLAQGGLENYITVTTRMLGRGTNWKTKYEDGFLLINLATDITFRSLWQIYGRAARNGQKGEIRSFFNKERISKDLLTDTSLNGLAEDLSTEVIIEEHMKIIAASEDETRLRSEPLTELLQFVNLYNKDDQKIAVERNDFIVQAWYDILKKENSKSETEPRKSYRDLRNDLVSAVRKQYSDYDFIKDLDAYLKKIDGGVPDKILQPEDYGSCGDLFDIKGGIKLYNQGKKLTSKYYSDIKGNSTSERCTKLKEDIIPVFSSTIHQKYEALYVTQDTEYKGEKITTNHFDPSKNLYNSMHIDWIEKPTKDGKYKTYYNNFYHQQLVKIYSSIFSDYEFEFSNNRYNIYLSKSDKKDCWSFWCSDDLKDDEIIVFAKDKSLHYRMKDKESEKIKKSSGSVEGVSEEDYNDVLTILKSDQDLATQTLPSEFQKWILKDAIISTNSDKVVLKDDLMLFEFRKLFEAYKSKYSSSEEINKINNLVKNSVTINNANINALELGKYQALSFFTKDGKDDADKAVHVEIILTNGKFLFWINNDNGSKGKSDIKIFKIIKNIKKVQSTFQELQKDNLKTSELHEKIFALFKHKTDIEKHKYITTELEDNSNWGRIQGIVKAMALAGRINDFETLPNQNSQEWQKLIKDASDIYLSFTRFVMIEKAEEILYSLDNNFESKFLSHSEKNIIDERREIIKKPVSSNFLTTLYKSVMNNISKSKLKNTVHEIHTHETLKELEVESTIDSQVGRALQSQYKENKREKTKALLKKYQDLNSLKHLAELHQVITKKISVQSQQDLVTQTLVEQIMNKSCYIDNMQEFSAKAGDIIGNFSQENLVCYIHNMQEFSAKAGDIVDFIGEQSELYELCYS